MAGKTTNKTTTKKKNNSGSAQQKKPAQKKTQNSSKAKSASQQMSRERYIDKAEKKAANSSFLSLQMKSVLLFASALLLLCISFVPGESIWEGFRMFLFGLFGVCAFLWPIFLLFVAVMIAMEKPMDDIKTVVIEISVLIILICAAVHIFAHDNTGGGWFRDIADAYSIGISQLNGGAFGAIIGGLLLFLGKIPAIFTICIVLLTAVLLITHTSLQTIMKKVSDGGKYIMSSENNIKSKKDIQQPQQPRFDKHVEPVREKPIYKPRKRRFNPDIPIDMYDDEPSDINNDAETDSVQPEPAKESVPDNVRLDDIIKKATNHKSEPVKQVSSNKSFVSPNSNYKYPTVDCLQEPLASNRSNYGEELKANAQKLVDILKSFGVETKIVDISRGPSVTRYELQPAAGVRINRISNLADDIALGLASSGVRIEAPIPNKAAVGIEVPNRSRAMVSLREIIDTPQFRSAKSKLNVALGKDIAGNIACADLAKMPHLLIAGTTGSGKSVCLNSMIVSILYNASPDEVKLLMIDPKKVEFSIYNGIPHLLVPVVSDPRKASGALGWAVTEMLNRYKLFSENNVRDMKGYNALCKKSEDKTPLPHIVIFIDELSDLMMAAPNEVEDSICRLAQMARAAGMHLVIATQRPSVDVITGLIKANIPSRLALSVSSSIDSRTILDMAGAEKLLGNGDMLFNPVGIAKPIRIQGCFISDEEVESVVEFITNQEKADYDEEVLKEIDRQAAAEKKKGSSSAVSDGDEEADEMLPKAIEVVVEAQAASTTLLQRRLRLGYARAARIVDELEARGIIGPYEGSKPRKVLITKQQWLEMNALSDDIPENSDDE